MNYEIQPKYNEITVTCSCGHVSKVGSTLGRDLQVEVCSQCHPFYTGKQQKGAAGGRIERFNRRFKRDTQKTEASEQK